MHIRNLFVAALVALVLPVALAQAPQRVERADQLPRFSYAIEGDLEAVVRDRGKFDALAQQVQRDVEGVLARYEIPDKAIVRRLHGVLLQLALLQERWDEALQRSQVIRELQEKPSDKLLSGILPRAIVASARRNGGTGSAAYQADVQREMRESLAALPRAVVRNDLMQMKAGIDLQSEAAALGFVREVLQPVATRSGTLSSDLVPGIVGARFALVYGLPLKPALSEVLGTYLAADRSDKPDIWAARDVVLPPGRGYAQVNVVVWDSGVDPQLFSERMIIKSGRPALIAFDKQGHASTEPLVPIPAVIKARLPQLLAQSKGLSDLQSNIDSPEAAAVRTLLSSLAPADYRRVQEEMRLTGNYEHGTHVAGIALAGNPYARLGVARIEFGHTLRPDPCPSDELVTRQAANMRAYGQFLKDSGARVVNMSWGGSLRFFEVVLEQCGIGKDAEERRAIGRRYFDQVSGALREVMDSLPQVLFVTAAGNSGNNSSFNEFYPSSFALPNLVVVGAVDKAGDEASFTSYGPTVVLHANGYQVESVVPGGMRIALSGTSMASPQVANLAAKLLAVQPSLKPAEVIDLMRRTAERSEDGRRTLIHPARALAAAGYRP